MALNKVDGGVTEQRELPVALEKQKGGGEEKEDTTKEADMWMWMGVAVG